MKKRLVTTLLMLAMALSLVACGGNGSDKDSQKPNTENSQDDDKQANKDTEDDKQDEPVDDGKIEYKVTLVDANGAPIAGKMVQVCNSATCFAPQQTDANGVATFRLEEANDYDVHDEDTVRVSLAKIFKVGVEDLDAIPNEYKTVEKGVIVTPKIDWAENELRTRGRLPAGFVDKSYTKFTWRLK